jgi:hypothetical protein
MSPGTSFSRIISATNSKRLAALSVVGRFLNEHSGIRNWLARGDPRRLASVADINKDYRQRPTAGPTDREAA